MSAAVLSFNNEYQAQYDAFPSPLDIAQYFYQMGVRDSLKASAEMADFQEHTEKWAAALAAGDAYQIPNFREVMEKWGPTMEKFCLLAEPYPDKVEG